jgi:hypothetical protein
MDWINLREPSLVPIIGLRGGFTSSQPAKPSGLEPMAYICETSRTPFTQGKYGEALASQDAV